jgi:hypothetical protein
MSNHHRPPRRSDIRLTNPDGLVASERTDIRIIGKTHPDARRTVVQIYHGRVQKW